MTPDEAAAMRENALSLLRDANGEQWIEPREISDTAAPDLRAARDVLRLQDELVQALRDVETVGEDLDACNARDDRLAAAAAELIRLKDGKNFGTLRGYEYRIRKEAAWDALRAALADDGAAR